ncbi:hypothetical protein GCM10011511_03010 [Puia dinghuensis]|uniref:Outer membrane protein beta-barrel domain-containing protein n=2 Tax=Puia dinghuensis TaxID=1792502 RepID=A0A8J2U7D8_9BACT|nr:hypothetical protein GCM10011511_03010 [Puia dinghuensis]
MRARQLREVIVRSAKPSVQQSIAGMVVNVQSSILNKGSSVLEVLERSPGVQLDHRNNTISLNGKAGITVMIDGKVMHMPEEEVMQLLNGMSADNIDKIELLSAPPSRYDASGSAGVINIVMKKIKRQGTTGAFSLYGGYGWGEKGGGSFSLDHNNGRTDWYGSYSFMHDHSLTSFVAGGTNLNPALGESSFDFGNATSYMSNVHNALAGFETRLRPRLSLGASLSYNNSTTSTITNNLGKYTLLPDSVLVYNGDIHGRSHWDNLIASLTAEKEIRKGEKLSIGFDWLDYTNNRPSTVLGSFVDSHGETVGITGDSLFASANKGYSSTAIGVGVAKVDYSVSFSDKVRFEAGVKGDYTSSTSRSGIESWINGAWVTNAASANAIRMREGIAAGYGSWHIAGGEKTTLDIGARYEYSRTRLNDAGTGESIADRRLGEWFPNLLLTRKVGEHSEWQLSFTRRITRPSYRALSSFISYNDPLSVITGNPLLKPTLTNNGKIGYLSHGYSFSLLFSRDDDPIFGWALTPQAGSQLVYIRPENLAFQHNLTLEVNLPFTVTSWWDMSYTLSGGWRQYRVTYTQAPAEKTWFGYSVNFHENLKLSTRLSAEVSGWYNSTSYEATVRTKGNGELNVGIKKELNKNRGSLQFSATDVLRGMNYKSYIGVVGKDAFDTRSYVNWNEESRQFPILKLTYTRSFGSDGKPKAERAGEEKSRIK